MSTTWPEGFVPHPDNPRYLNNCDAQDFFAEQVRAAALAWTATQGEAQLEWADNFADWSADRSKLRLGNWRMPSFARWWTTFYAEPIDYGDGPEPEPGEPDGDP